MVSQFYLDQPCDGFWATGQIVVSPIKGLIQILRNSEDKECKIGSCLNFPFTTQNAYVLHRLRLHALEYTVRCFYGPLMFCSICDNLPMLHFRGFENFMDFFNYSQNLIFTIDLCFATVGYLSPASFLSTEPTLMGWVGALICYNPFFPMIGDKFLGYGANKPWNEWFDAMNGQQNASEWLSFRVWGVCILILQLMFAYCTVCFGLRYSNLSYRTVVTSGPYYFLRHPAYTVKLVSFFMLHVPFVDIRTLSHIVTTAKNNKDNDSGSGIALWSDQRRAYLNGQACRYCIALLLLTLVYIVRAYTEETHLTAVSGGSYQRYVEQITRRSWFGLGQVLNRGGVGISTLIDGKGKFE